MHTGGPTPKLLDPAVEAEILKNIEEGAWDYVACMAAGISQQTFCLWMRKGAQQPQSIYGEFRTKVERARSKARVECERIVRAAEPKEWLRLGPGRERQGQPGWGTSTTISSDSESQEEFEDSILETIKEINPDFAIKVIERLQQKRDAVTPNVATSAHGTEVSGL